MRGCEQRHAERQSARHEAGRDRGCRVVEQVHEIGVITERRVEPDRVGLDRVDAIVRAGRGRDGAVGVCPHRIGDALEFFQAVHGGIGRLSSRDSSP